MVRFRVQALGDNNSILSECFSTGMPPVQVIFLTRMLFLALYTTIILAMQCLRSSYGAAGLKPGCGLILGVFKAKCTVVGVAYWLRA